MNKNILLLIPISFISLLAGVALFHLLTPGADISSAEAKTNTQKSKTEIPLVAIPLTDLDGNQKLVGNWSQPVLVINFWAPWCAPCREEIPALIALQKELEGQVQVLGLALDGEDNIRSFEAEYGMNYPSFVAGNQIPMYNAAFNNTSGALPFTAIINQQRKIHYKHTGQITLEQLRNQISPLL